MNRSNLRQTLGAAVAAFLLLTLDPPGASGEDATAPVTVRELYELSGLRSQIGSTAGLVNLGLAQMRSQVAPEVLDEVALGLQRAYAASTLEEGVLDDLERRYHPRYAAFAAAWLRSPPGRLIARLEAESATSEGARAFEKFAATLQDSPPSPERLALEKRFDEAMQSTAFMLELTIETSLGIAFALDASLPGDRRTAPEQMRADVEARREWLEPMLRQASIVAFLYTYRELSDEEIEAYIAFAETDAGRWYKGAVTGAFIESVTSASRSLAGG